MGFQILLQSPGDFLIWSDVITEESLVIKRSIMSEKKICSESSLNPIHEMTLVLSNTNVETITMNKRKGSYGAETTHRKQRLGLGRGNGLLFYARVFPVVGEISLVSSAVIPKLDF